MPEHPHDDQDNQKHAGKVKREKLEVDAHERLQQKGRHGRVKPAFLPRFHEVPGKPGKPGGEPIEVDVRIMAYERGKQTEKQTTQEFEEERSRDLSGDHVEPHGRNDRLDEEDEIVGVQGVLVNT